MRKTRVYKRENRLNQCSLGTEQGAKPTMNDGMAPPASFIRTYFTVYNYKFVTNSA